MRTREDCFALVGDYFRHTAAPRYDVRRMAIYGSVSRGEHHEGSDVDIIYEGEPNLFDRISMKSELEQLLQCKVDIIRMNGQVKNSKFGERIKRDMIYV